jgi:predicted ATPase
MDCPEASGHPNHLSVVTSEVVEVARESLVIGVM